MTLIVSQVKIRYRKIIIPLYVEHVQTYTVSMYAEGVWLEEKGKASNARLINLFVAAILEASIGSSCA